MTKQFTFTVLKWDYMGRILCKIETSSLEEANRIYDEIKTTSVLEAVKIFINDQDEQREIFLLNHTDKGKSGYHKLTTDREVA